MEANRKAKFFALYYDQKCAVRENDFYIYTITPAFLDNNIEESHLLLRTIDQLTDEELVNLSIISDKDAEDEFEKESHIINGEYIVDCLKKDARVDLQVYDYLRSISILLPFTYLDNNTPTTLSVDDILGMGWVILTPPTLK